MNIARRGLWGIGLIALVTAVAMPTIVLPNPVEAQRSFADTRCRRALHGGAQRLYRTILAKQAACHRQRMLGKLSPLRDCTDPDRLPSSQILDLIESNQVQRAQNACSGTPASLGFQECNAPCAHVPIRNFADVGRCIACQAKTEARRTTENIYASPPVPGRNDSAVRCQSVMGDENIRYATSLLTSHRRCQYLQDRGAISALVDCRRADFFRIFTRSRDVLSRRIERICTFESTTSLTGCKDSTNELNCILEQARESTDFIFQQVYQRDDQSPGKVVFLTARAYTAAEIGGIAGADAICQATAESSELSLRGTFLAWLSAGDVSPASRFNKPANAPYFLLNGAQIAPNFATLVTTHPESAIDVDENGRDVVFERPVWTGTAGTGAAVASGATCSGWTSDEGMGVIGLPYFIGGGLWTNSQAIACARPAHLYCFQQ